MEKKPTITAKKILPYFLYVLLLAGQIYAIFIWNAPNESSWYFKVILICFILYCVLGVLIVRINIKPESRSTKKITLMAMAFLVLVQLVLLPISNIYSRTLPVWPPRGSVYQIPYLKSTLVLNEVGLFMSYYLDGKTLYTNKVDDPKDFDNSRLFIEDEYILVDNKMPILDDDQVRYFTNTNKNDYYTFNISGDPKRKIDGFKIFIYALDDYTSYDEIALYKDNQKNWYLIPKDFSEDMLGGNDE